MTDFSRDKLTLERSLLRFGLEPNYTTRSASVDPAIHFEFCRTASAEHRKQANVVESLLTGIRALEWHEPVLALRCLLQAREYVGSLGPWAGLSQEHDIAIGMQNALEALLKGNHQ